MNANELRLVVFHGLQSDNIATIEAANELLREVCEMAAADFHGVSEVLRNKRDDRDNLQAMYIRLRVKLDYAEATK